MTEYNEGDLVEAVNDSGDKLTGRLGVTETGHFYLGAYNWTFPNWVAENAGFKHITVIEKAAPKNVLPTEPGIYADNEGDYLIVYSDGEVQMVDRNKMTQTSKRKPLAADSDYAPFTRLEPAHVTAKKVIERFEKLHLSDNMWLDDVAVISAEFGVTS